MLHSNDRRCQSLTGIHQTFGHLNAGEVSQPGRVGDAASRHGATDVRAHACIRVFCAPPERTLEPVIHFRDCGLEVGRAWSGSLRARSCRPHPRPRNRARRPAGARSIDARGALGERALPAKPDFNVHQTFYGVCSNLVHVLRVSSGMEGRALVRPFRGRGIERHTLIGAHSRRCGSTALVAPLSDRGLKTRLRGS